MILSVDFLYLLIEMFVVHFSLGRFFLGSSTFSVVLAQYPLLRRRNLSTYFERYYRNV